MKSTVFYFPFDITEIPEKKHALLYITKTLRIKDKGYISILSGVLNHNGYICSDNKQYLQKFKQILY